MSYKKHEKQELPSGWLVKQSKSYQRVYYFNTLTGVSTWEVPEVLKPYLKPPGNRYVNKPVGSSKSKPETRLHLLEPHTDVQEGQFSPTQDSDEEDSLDLEQQPHERANTSSSVQSLSFGSESLRSGNSVVNQHSIVNQHEKNIKLGTRQGSNQCRVTSQPVLCQTPELLKQKELSIGKCDQPHSSDSVKVKTYGSLSDVQTTSRKKIPTNDDNLTKSGEGLTQGLQKRIGPSPEKLSSHSSAKHSNLKRNAESFTNSSYCSKTTKRQKTSEISDFSDSRKVVKKLASSPSSAVDTFNLSPRESSPDPDNLLLGDLKKREDIQSWINHLESDEVPSDSLGEILDPGLDQDSEDAGNLILDRSSRRVMLLFNDSGFLSLGDTSNISGITMTIKNDGPVKKAIVNPWKGVHENPVPIHHNRREEISMEIDEVQQVLNKEEERQIEEMDVSDIVLREVRDSVKKCPDEVIGQLTQVFTTDQPEHIHNVDQDLYIVVDTNVFISNLAFVEDLRDHCFENFGLPVLVIPWVVMQELDALKSNKSSAATMSMKIGKCARAAVGYIYQCFQDNHQRVIGQGAAQASAASKEFQAECSDDRILQTCMQCQKNRLNSTVILLSNDKNLLNKARVCKITAFDRFRLLNGIKCLQTKRPYKIEQTIVHKESLEKPSKAGASCPVDVPPDNHSHLLDEMLCKLKMWLKDALSSVLETEMKAAYDDIWMEIVLRKPPWTLSDVLECFKKHWIAVFGQIYERSLVSIVDRLCARFKPVTHFQVSVEILLYLLNDCLGLLEECNKHNKNDLKVAEALFGMKKCEELCRDLKTGGVKVNSIEDYLKGKPKQTDIKTKMCMDKNKNNVDQLSVEDVESKLTNIWEVVYFCCEDFQSVIENRRRNCSTDPEQLEKMSLVFQKLIPALDAIRYEYEQALRFSPKEILEKAALVHGLCVQLNSFYIRLNLKAKDGELEVANLQALFGIESKRQMLKDGLDHLDKMIHKIHEQMKIIQG